MLAMTEATNPQPKQQLAVLTCMDARIDVFSVLGLEVGDAYVLRNAGGRVTDDVLRSLTLASHVLGVSRVIVMQHTRCGLLGVTDEQLRARTGADLPFLTISDQTESVRGDVAQLAQVDYLSPILQIEGAIYDLDRETVDTVVRWER
jgi:carbonic anhydrase